MRAVAVILLRRFSELLIAFFLCALTVRAQENASPGRGDFGVPLQPFLAGQSANDSPRAEPIRVAYYAPRPQPAPAPVTRTESVEKDNDDTEIANEPPIIRSNRPIVEGSRAVLRSGIACAPSEAPDNIKNAIWAVNPLRRKPYVCGGGHGSCSA